MEHIFNEHKIIKNIFHISIFTQLLLSVTQHHPSKGHCALYMNPTIFQHYVERIICFTYQKLRRVDSLFNYNVNLSHTVMPKRFRF